MKSVGISEALNVARAGTREVSPTSAGAFTGILSQLIKVEGTLDKKLPSVPQNVLGLFQLQKSCSMLQLQVECLSRVADSVSASIKKVQSLGGQG